MVDFQQQSPQRLFDEYGHIACCMKTWNKGFGAPGYQIFDFKPFMFLLKNNKF